MKELSLLVWMTQLGLSVALPMVGFVYLAVWLKNTYHLGAWVIVVGVIFGLICAVNGLVTSLKAMQSIVKSKKKKKPPVSFNDHD